MQNNFISIKLESGLAELEDILKVELEILDANQNVKLKVERPRTITGFALVEDAIIVAVATVVVQELSKHVLKLIWDAIVKAIKKNKKEQTVTISFFGTEITQKIDMLPADPPGTQ